MIRLLSRFAVGLVPTLAALAALVCCVLAPTARGADLPTERILALTLESTAADHSAFDRLLAANVRDQRVDYLNLRRSHMGDLAGYLNAMAEIDASSLSKPEALAYWINVYNAAVLKAVAERMDRDYAVSRNDFALFKELIVPSKTGMISLDQIENEIVRPKYKEPLVHVGFVCGALSCPPLLPRAYVGATVMETLDANMKTFINDQNRTTADDVKKEIQICKIFEWYADDFGGKDKVLAYIDRYHPNDLSGFTVLYKEYDWTLNFAPPSGTHWISITVNQADVYSAPGSDTIVGQVKKLQILESLEQRNDWHRVLLPGAVTGWVPAEVIEDFAG